jgi:hypothetical protein
MLKYFFCGVIVFATKLETKCNILNQVNHALLQTMFTVHALIVTKGKSIGVLNFHVSSKCSTGLHAGPQLR